MIIYGLTGSIGMGKSTAADMIRHMGVPVHDADEVVHELLGPGGDAVQCVKASFPDCYSGENHSIDREKLGKIVFDDEPKMRQLESILHPMVQAREAEFVQQNKRTGQTKVVLDIPLLFETGANQRVDKVICVKAPAFIQRMRVMRRNGMTKNKFEQILSRQMPSKEKEEQSDYIVHTGLGRAYTYRALRAIMMS